MHIQLNQWRVAEAHGKDEWMMYPLFVLDYANGTLMFLEKLMLFLNCS